MRSRQERDEAVKTAPVLTGVITANRAVAPAAGSAPMPRKHQVFTAAGRRGLSASMSGAFGPKRPYDDLSVWSSRRRDGRGSR